MMNVNEIKKIIEIIEEPIHGKKFYTKEQLFLLVTKLIEIKNTLKIDGMEKKEIVNIVLGFVKNNVLYRKSYFDCFTGKSEVFDSNNVKYRTAYGALVEGEAMCAGFAEALRVLLSMYNVKSYTIISKLPLERKKLLHYVVIVEIDGEYIVLDPESMQYCEKNRIDYNLYMESCIYTIPDKIFTDDVLGKNGSGMLAEEYLKRCKTPRTIGTKQIYELIKHIDREESIDMQER